MRDGAKIIYNMISQKVRRIRTKIGGQVGCVTSTIFFDFREDLDPDTVIFKSDSLTGVEKIMVLDGG